MLTKSKQFDSKIWFERITLKDKKSYFRSSEPDQYILRIMGKGSRCDIVLREFFMSSRKERDEHYKLLRSMFE